MQGTLARNLSAASAVAAAEGPDDAGRRHPGPHEAAAAAALESGAAAPAADGQYPTSAYANGGGTVQQRSRSVRMGGIGVYSGGSSDSKESSGTDTSSGSLACAPTDPSTRPERKAEARWACWPKRSAADDSRKPAPASAHAPSWFAKEKLKWAVVRREASRNADFALYLAMQIDQYCLWILALGYTISVALIAGIGASTQPAYGY